MNNNNFTVIVIFWLFCFLGCKEGETKVANFDVGQLHFEIESAGIGYEVNNEKLDSSGGLKYIIALSIFNNGDSLAKFDGNSFRLIDGRGDVMPSSGENGNEIGAININAISTNVDPGKSELIMLFYTVKGHGNYLFEIRSPTTGEHRVVDLPGS